MSVRHSERGAKEKRVTLRLDRAGNIMAIAKGTQLRRHFLGSSHARITIGGDEAALIRPSREQNIQMKSQKCLVVLTKDTRQTPAHAAKSSMAQAPRLRPGGRKSSRTSHRRRRTAAKLTTFMAGVGRSMKPFAILWQKLHARFSEHIFNQGSRVVVSRAATHLGVRGRVSMKTGCLSQIPNRPIERSTAIRICALVYRP